MIETEKIWRSFDRWVSRFYRVSVNAEPGLHVRMLNELFDETDELDVKDTRARLRNKINFLRGYFVNISYDGPEFMKDKGVSSLKYQYPSQCDNAFGVWLVIYDTGIKEFPGLHFAEDEVSLFCRDISNLDWESVYYGVMPFDSALIRLPKGASWDKSIQKTIVKAIKEDLDFVGYRHKLDSKLVGNLCQIDIVKSAI